LLEDSRERESAGRSGIYSIYSAHRLVIEAAILQSKADGSPLLIEATGNQVNHQGGYTGMRPREFRAYVAAVAEQLEFPVKRLILGGDHIGRNPWRKTAGERGASPGAYDGDRVTDPQVEASVRTLFNNLVRHPAPLALLSQFLSEQHRACARAGLRTHRAWCGTALRRCCPSMPAPAACRV
jgi:tagatose-1,6-bisphosphate aldolase non-catalytic subunit AgaZ/GatZ